MISTRRLATCLLLALPSLAWSQASDSGLTLYAPMTTTNTYIVDVNGTVQHSWPSAFLPGVAVYLRDNGNVVRTKRTMSGPGGVGGGIQEIRYDGTLVWDWNYDGPGVLSHHDLALLPNGNVLVLAWDEHTAAEAIANGRNPGTVASAFTPEHVIEVEPTGLTTANIVWEWYAFDHLVQDFDPGQANFGVVADHPELVDVNFPPGVAPFNDWLHANGLDYDAELDQIMISVRNFDELWVIDHSTTTAEAAGHTGGNSGKGGDLLYRWGNPQAYGRGTALDQVLDGQHDANWVLSGYPGDGNIVVFNNFAGPNFSSVIELQPPVDGSGNYTIAPGMAFGPTAPVWEYTAPIPSDLFSPFVGGAVRLSNGNTLITEGAVGFALEVDPAGTTVWSHTNVDGGPFFKLRRYKHFLWSSAETVSLSAGGSVDLHALAGSDQAGRFYLVLGSAGGTSPGFTFGGATLPLNPIDPYFLFTLKNIGLSPLTSSFGLLDGLGQATAQFALPAASDPALAGIELHHAFAVLTPGVIHLTSNALPLELVP